MKNIKMIKNKKKKKKKRENSETTEMKHMYYTVNSPVISAPAFGLPCYSIDIVNDIPRGLDRSRPFAYAGTCPTMDPAPATQHTQPPCIQNARDAAYAVSTARDAAYASVDNPHSYVMSMSRIKCGFVFFPVM